MKTKWLFPLLIVVVLAGGVPCAAAERVTLYLFHSRGCVNCIREEEFLAGLQRRIPGFELRQFEVQRNPDNARLLVKTAAAFGIAARGVPVTFIGPEAPIEGFESDETTGRLIEQRVRDCLARGCEDVVGPLVGAAPAAAPPGVSPAPPVAGAAPPGKPPGAGTDAPIVSLPLFGNTDLSTTPLLMMTVIIGALDSFNPCAFFVLFSLLGILIHAQSRRRMFLIGGVFVLFSGVVYFVFMAAWLNVFLYIGELQAVTGAAGVIALCVAAINIKDFFFFKRGISLTIPESKKPGLFARMRGLLRENSLPAMLLGTAVLALAANTYELLCTAGFPMVFTRILTLNNLHPLEYYLYLALYNLVYILPLAAVVALFSATLGARKLSEAQGRVMKLVSGLMMLGLGTVVLADPNLFNNALFGVALLAFALLAAGAIVGLEKWRLARGGQH